MSSAAVIRIFESELDQILERVVGSPTTETGGELIGLWSHADSPTVMLAGVTVVLAGGPSAKSRGSSTNFEQDPETHMGLERLMWEQFGFQVVGMWHSHHQLSLHELSAGDIRRTMTYSSRHSRPRYSEILAFILRGEPTEGPGIRVGLRPHVYENAGTGLAVHTTMEVLPGESPLRQALTGRSLPINLVEATEDARRRERRVPFLVKDHLPPGRGREAPPKDGGRTMQTTVASAGEPKDAQAAVSATPPIKEKRGALARLTGTRKPGAAADEETSSSQPADEDPPQLDVLGQIIGGLPREVAQNLRVVHEEATGVTELRLRSMRAPEELVVHVAGLGSADVVIRASRETGTGAGVKTAEIDLKAPPSPAVLALLLRQGAHVMGYRV
jgi:hypothetical protein